MFEVFENNESNVRPYCRSFPARELSPVLEYTKWENFQK